MLLSPISSAILLAIACAPITMLKNLFLLHNIDIEIAAPTVLESQILPTSGIIRTDSKQSAISTTVIDEPGSRLLC